MSNELDLTSQLPPIRDESTSTMWKLLRAYLHDGSLEKMTLGDMLSALRALPVETRVTFLAHLLAVGGGYEADAIGDLLDAETAARLFSPCVIYIKDRPDRADDYESREDAVRKLGRKLQVAVERTEQAESRASAAEEALEKARAEVARLGDAVEQAEHERDNAHRTDVLFCTTHRRYYHQRKHCPKCLASK